MYELNHIETCTDSYFSGSSKPYVQIAVDCNTTYKDVKIALLAAQEHEFCNLPDDFDWEMYNEAVLDLFANFTTLDYVPDSFADIEPLDADKDCYETCNMYFAITIGE